MELKKLTIDGKQVEFVNAFRGTRNGFAHDTTLFIDGYVMAQHTCHYLNRTWERYTYQTVMRCAVCDLEEERENRLKDKFKTEKGYAKLTPKRKLELAEVIDADEDMRFYRAILAQL